jgi:hypothetical protein
VDAPDRQYDAVLTEGAIPRAGVLVVGVAEGAVDVEDRDRALGFSPYTLREVGSYGRSHIRRVRRTTHQLSGLAPKLPTGGLSEA